MQQDVDHHGVEFGYELGAVVPFVHYLYQKRELGNVYTNTDMLPFYFFTDKVNERTERRHSHKLKRCLSDGIIPNIKLHVNNWDYSRWSPPNYKEAYANDEFAFDVVVTNKFNKEWGGSPVNFYSPETLDKIFSLLHGKSVLYNHMTSDMGRDDTVDSLKLCEWDIVRKYPNVIKVQDLLGKYTYNELQLRIYANAKLFITVQGGSSILASYFGGTNIIYAVKGQELKFNEYNTWYPRLSGSNIIHCDSYDKVLNAIKDKL
jgi:hypothetical protein